MKQLIWGTIAFLQAHPRIREPGIFYPVINPQINPEPQEIKVQSWRTYGGIELIEPGLTIAVYPIFDSFSTTKGAVTMSSGRNNSCTYEPYTLGARDDLSYQETAKYRLVVQAFYQDPVALGEEVKIPIDKLIDDKNLAWPFHGFNMQMRDPHNPTNPQQDFFQHRDDMVLPFAADLDSTLLPDEVTLAISPGEEILREWMDLLRLALSDLPTMMPFKIRSTQVEMINYPTSTWIRQSTDIFFHTAYIVWCLDLFPPASWRHINTIPPIDVALETFGEVNVTRQPSA